MKSGRLLLADRHLGVVGGAHALVHDLFDSVVMVSDEKSLTEAVTELSPNLVIMDLSLPQGRETELAGRLLASHPGLRLIVLSIHGEASVANQLISAGVAGFVCKQAVGMELLPAVQAVIAGGTYVSPTIHALCQKGTGT